MRLTWPAERVLAALADSALEAAWLTIVYLLVQPWIGDGVLHMALPPFAVAALAGLLFARSAAGLERDTYTLAGTGAAILAAVIGTLAFVPEVAATDPWAALRAHPGGLLAGVAFLRGSAHAEDGAEGANVETILAVGLFGLVPFWGLLTLSGLTTDPAYAAAALGASITFVTAGLLAMGLARLAALGSEGVTRPTRRRWLGLLFAVLGGALVVSLPLAAVLGVPLGVALLGVLGPIGAVIVGLVVLFTLPFAFLAGWLTEFFRQYAPGLGQILDLLRQGGLGRQQPAPESATTSGDGAFFGYLIIAIIAIAIVVFVAVRMLGRVTVRTPTGEPDEVRVTEIPPPRLRLPRISLPRRPHAPRTAREAYLAALELFSGTDASRRVDETPAEHAQRVARPDFGRLAVDYELDAFAGRTLNPPEERRALLRWDRLRRTVPRRRTHMRPTDANGEGAEGHAH